MTLLLSDEALAARRRAVADGGSLVELAQSLANDLDRLLAAGPSVPTAKALLSREGGRCPADGTLLDFDPWSPREHRCPSCGRVYTGEYHDLFWLYWYQLWLAERSVHAALLAALGFGRRYESLARDILLAYAERYAGYPNVDNVLGPTRVFFSTYLESMWLLQVCVAADLLTFCGDSSTRATVTDRIVEPSADLIASYDEGASNRQVWNNAALMAVALLRGRPDHAEEWVFGRSGLVSHLGAGLLSDGTWYEGENYHQFAHRGLWYGVVMAETAGIELPDALLARFREGFATPFMAALPDFTLPSRRDSQYAISLRQWRYAELAELGLARGDDERLVGALHRIYADDLPAGDTGRSRSSAEAERNSPSMKLTRADLGWRSLLRAREQLPPLHHVDQRSVLLDAQGLAILRADSGRSYVALDYGHSGGGHGHPDRLDLLIACDANRWLDDPGTGSYTDPSLHWYRSTLAHNAPLADGHSQQRVHGELLAWDDHGDVGWVSARVEQIAPGVVVERTLVTMPGYVVDELVWHAEHEATIDLPVHFDAAAPGLALRPDTLAGGHDLEDGFDFLVDALSADVRAGKLVALDAAAATGERLRVWASSNRDSAWWRVTAPGPPGSDPKSFWLIRSTGEAGAHRFVYAWSDSIVAVQLNEHGVSVRLADGVRHEHSRTIDGWRVEVAGPAGNRSVALGGRVHAKRRIVDAPVVPAESSGSPRLRRVHPKRRSSPIAVGAPRSIRLGERHYIPSEQSWHDAGSPTAEVGVRCDDDTLLLTIDAHVGGRALTFVPVGARNPYDNEQPDINGDGVQIYLRAGQRDGAWMLVPDVDSSTVRIRSISDWPADLQIEATWHRTPDGYHIDARVSLGAAGGDRRHMYLDVLVNEKPPGRERRRGQLALSGRRGQFVYLRGDRQDRAALIPFTFRNA